MKKRLFLLVMSTVLVVACIAAQSMAMAASAVVDVKDYLSADKWTDDGGDVTVSADKILFNNGMGGDFAALKMVDEFDTVTYRFNIKLEDLPTGLSEEEGTWWDSELVFMVRAKVAGTTYTDGQAGYCITSFGDHSGFYVGKSGNDDYFTKSPIAWDLADGKEHSVEFSVENNADGSVSLKLAVDDKVLFEGVDKGEVSGDKKVEQQKKIHTDKGALMIRCKYMTATITPFTGKGTASTDTSSADTSKPANSETSNSSPSSGDGADSNSLFWTIIIIASVVVAICVVAGIVVALKKKSQ